MTRKVRAHPCRCASRFLACASVLLLLLSASPVAGGDIPFTYPSNQGLTGLMETPTARVMPVNRYRLGASVVDPYRQYYGAVGLFPRLEVTGRITEVSGTPGFDDFGGYGDFKDKAFDAKFQILREGKYAPALAVAVLDPHGTRIYSAQAIVASKQVFPFDFTAGMGNGRLGKRPLPGTGERFGLEMFTDPKEWWADARLFGGIQFAPSEKFALMAEYSPVEYHRQERDPAQERFFRDKVPSRFNFGLRWRPTRWSEIDATWQRGNQFGVNVSVAFDIGKPLIPIYDPPYRELPEWTGDPHSERIIRALAGSGFSDIGVESDGITLRVEAQNDRYFFPVRAVEVILDIVAPRMPAHIEYVRIQLTENGVPALDFVTTRTGIALFHAGEIGRDRFLERSTFKTDEDLPSVSATVHRRRHGHEVKPILETFLNDPSGFFKYRFGLSARVSGHPWRGGSVVAGAEGYPVNTVSTSNAPLSRPVRSDLVEYKKEDVALGRLLFEQIGKTRFPLYGRIAAGLLEVEYAGFDGEIAMPLFSGRILAGAGGSLVRKRKADDPFGLLSGKDFHTAFVNGRLDVPEADLWVDVKAGRFLAGDEGARITLSKSVNGVVLSAWYSITDTSDFTDDFNRGYHDKGISVDIPIRLFLGRDSRTSYRYALSPWTRDVGQDVDHDRTLFDTIGRNTGIRLDKDSKDILFVNR